MPIRDLLSQLRRMRLIAARKRTPQLVSARVVEAAATHPTPRTHRQANWLEDALRLRPPRRTRDVLLTTNAPASQTQGKRHAEVVAGTTHTTTHTASDTSERQAAPHSETHRADIPPALSAATPPGAPTTPRATDAGSSTGSSPSRKAQDHLAEVEGKDVVQRRLELVRYLVRRRVYNEGFSPDATPEQYTWSTPPTLPPTSD